MHGSSLSYDSNDTVLDSAWYKAESLLPNNHREKDAKTEMHYDTPAIMLSDTLSRPF
jgi:hypothetical protein